MHSQEAQTRADPTITNCKAVMDCFGNINVYHGFENADRPDLGGTSTKVEDDGLRSVKK